jgi:hypothetical protein
VALNLFIQIKQSLLKKKSKRTCCHHIKEKPIDLYTGYTFLLNPLNSGETFTLPELFWVSPVVGIAMHGVEVHLDQGSCTPHHGKIQMSSVAHYLSNF